jgi:hypothetical protein
MDHRGVAGLSLLLRGNAFKRLATGGARGPSFETHRLEPYAGSSWPGRVRAHQSEPLGILPDAKWAPDGRTLYSIDYHRGIDILRYNGCLYVPGTPSCGPGELYGTDDQPPAAALRAARRGEARLLSQMRAVGWFPGYCQLIAQRTNGA